MSTEAGACDIGEQEELLLSQLPTAESWFKSGVTLYQDCWFPSNIIPNLITFQRKFEPQDQDIILASKPKSGTTWLKSLLFSIRNRRRYTRYNTPLLTTNPHRLVPTFEFTLYSTSLRRVDINSIPSPRLLSTHVPYASLPDSIKSSKCRIVYVCRNPLDLIVSFWHFSARGHPQARSQWTMEECIETFCKGQDEFGPYWNHVLGYWKESLESPEKVLFLKYEDMKKDTAFQVKRIAEFIGFSFSKEEESNGVVEQILELCSLSNLKDLDVNKHGQVWPTFENKLFFRKGEVGDWVNHLSPSMVERVKNVTQEKLSGSGLSFDMHV